MLTAASAGRPMCPSQCSVRLGVSYDLRSRYKVSSARADDPAGVPPPNFPLPFPSRPPPL